MLHSMTAFSRRMEQLPEGRLTWELRGVNHRYFEVNFRLPEGLRGLEPALRDIARKYIHRGKVEASLRLQMMTKKQEQLDVNLPLVKSLLQATSELQPLLGNDQTASLGINELLRWPGVVVAREEPDEESNQMILSSFDAACKDLQSARKTEGEALAKGMQERLDQITSILQKLTENLPDVSRDLKQKLEARAKQLMTEVDPVRFEQEVLFYLQKSDAAEELDRLNVHIDEYRRQMQNTDVVGRRLDFMLQEMNREANTLGAKAYNATVSHAAVDLKVLIEQIREQVQNVE